MIDILFTSGALHRDIGPISSLVPQTQKGRDWLITEMNSDLSDGAAIIETSNLEIVLDCAETDGVTTAAA